MLGKEDKEESSLWLWISAFISRVGIQPSDSREQARQYFLNTLYMDASELKLSP